MGELIIGGALGLGSAILGNRSQNRAIDSAERRSAREYDRSINYLEETRDQNRADLEPFRRSDLQRRQILDWLMGAGPNPETLDQPGNVSLPGMPGGQSPGFPGGRPGGLPPGLFNVLGDGPQMAFTPQASTGSGAETAGAAGDPRFASPLAFFENSLFNQAFDTQVGQDRDRISSNLAGSGLAYSGVREAANADATADRFSQNLNALFAGLSGDTGAMAAGLNNNSQFGVNAANLTSRQGDFLASSALQRGQNNSNTINDIFGIGAYTLGNSGLFGGKK